MDSRVIMATPHLLLLASLIVYGQACGLGRTVTNLVVTKSGEYSAQCSVRAYPNCPQLCIWTNQTCAEAAEKYKWKKEELIMTNTTYGMPVEHVSKKSDREYEVKGVQRRCCTASAMEATPCRTADWKPAANKSQDQFDVIQYATKTMKCPTKNAIVRDVKVKEPESNHLSIEVCCFNYTTNYDGRVTCQAPWHPGDKETAIALPLALALGIGIPLGIVVEQGCPVFLSDTNAIEDPDDTITGSSPTKCMSTCLNYRPHPKACNYDNDQYAGTCFVYKTFKPSTYTNVGSFLYVFIC